MRLAELSGWVDQAIYPSFLISNGALSWANAAAKRLVSGNESGVITLTECQQCLPGLMDGIARELSSWSLTEGYSGEPLHVESHRFWDDIGQRTYSWVLQLIPLAWPNAPVGFNASWLSDSSGGRGLLPLLINQASECLSAPQATLTALGLADDASLSDFWTRVRPTDLSALQQCLSRMQGEQWRVSETLDFCVRSAERAAWVRWQIELRRVPPMRDGDQWLMATLRPLDAEVGQRYPAQNHPVTGKVGAGSLMVVQLMGLRDFIEGASADLGQALTNQFKSAVMGLLGDKDRGWKLSDDNLAIWFAGDTRGRRSDAFWERLIRLLQRPLVFRDTQHRARIRAGRARAVNPESRAEHLIERALAGLLESKAGSITQASSQTDRYTEAARTVRRKQNQLLKDFDEGRYRMIYQPIAHPDDLSDPVGVEALSRSVSANGDLFSGGDIVQAAQRHDFVREWTLWGLESVRRDMGDWLAERPDRFVTFNVMPSLLNDAASLEWLIARLSELPEHFRQCLNLEITEQAVGSLIHRDALTRIRRLGLELYLDDFGAGDSNLYRLIDIKPEVIKLDRFLIELIMDDEPQLAVLNQVLRLARTISPRIIAEGIETEQQFELVRRLDVDLVQGYYIGRRLDLKTGATLGALSPSN